MIGPSGAVRVMVATKPVDFPQENGGLATLVREHGGKSLLGSCLCVQGQAGGSDLS